MMHLKIALISVIVAAISSGQNVDIKISRLKGNILRNLTAVQEFEDHIVTSSLDNSPMIRMFYRGFRELYSRLVSGTGDRHNSDRFQSVVSNKIPFPCNVHGFRSDKVPKSVHKLRPGGKMQ